jgi:putative membrane protein
LIEPAANGAAHNDEHRGYAEQRTLLANERTYAAWIRTGLAALAAGIAVERFTPGTIPDWTARLIAMLLIILSVAFFSLALWRYRHLEIRFPKLERVTIALPVIWISSLLLIMCALLALIGIWLA